MGHPALTPLYGLGASRPTLSDTPCLLWLSARTMVLILLLIPTNLRVECRRRSYDTLDMRTRFLMLGVTLMNVLQLVTMIMWFPIPLLIPRPRLSVLYGRVASRPRFSVTCPPVLLKLRTMIRTPRLSVMTLLGRPMWFYERLATRTRLLILFRLMNMLHEATPPMAFLRTRFPLSPDTTIRPRVLSLVLTSVPREMIMPWNLRPTPMIPNLTAPLMHMLQLWTGPMLTRELGRNVLTLNMLMTTLFPAWYPTQFPTTLLPLRVLPIWLYDPSRWVPPRERVSRLPPLLVDLIHILTPLFIVRLGPQWNLEMGTMFLSPQLTPIRILCPATLAMAFLMILLIPMPESAPLHVLVTLLPGREQMFRLPLNVP